MEAETASDIAEALLTAYGAEDPALAAEWTSALNDVPEPRAWAIHQPHSDPEAVILTAHHICRVTVPRPPAVGAGASELVIDRYPIDDSIRLFSGPGKWTLTFPRTQSAVVLKAEPVPRGQQPGRLRSVVKAIWDDLPEASRGSSPPA